jgi:hypothetical protein
MVCYVTICIIKSQGAIRTAGRKPTMVDGANDEDTGASHESPEPAMPRWVKVGMVVFVAIILVVIILVMSGAHQPPAGGHGP